LNLSRSQHSVGEISSRGWALRLRSAQQFLFEQKIHWQEMLGNLHVLTKLAFDVRFLLEFRQRGGTFG